ncbi:protein AKNAD1 [Otolemur garnettii]|uniref:protein AKNAD1 n=1 Tax=Otolemur garnettii TaxID=30611 RepID=UPI000C7EFC2E|nr:protein AKNAD1 [Otolemur garnettii]
MRAGSRGQERSGCSSTDDVSEDTTYQQQEDLPYDGSLSQTDDGFASKIDLLDSSNQIILTENDSQENATADEICRNAARAMPPGKMTENLVVKHDKQKQCPGTPHIPANKGNTPKPNTSDILLRHLSKDQFLRSQSTDCETAPEISNVDSFEAAAMTNNITAGYRKSAWPQEETSELTDQVNPHRDGARSSKPGCSPNTTEENTSDTKALAATRAPSPQENSNFVTKVRGPRDQQKSCRGQWPQKQHLDKASSSTRFKSGRGRVHRQLSDFCKAVPKVKIPKNNLMNKPFKTAKQANFSPKLRSKSAMVQSILETMPRSKCVEKRHQEKEKITKAAQHRQVESIEHIHRELLTGIESETSLSMVSSTSQKDPSSSSPNILQKIYQGKQMCQKLSEQTDQLKTKVQEFSKRIRKDSLSHLQDKRMVLENLQGHLEPLEQKFLATKYKHQTLQQHTHKHESATIGDFDREKKVEGEISRLEMLLEGIKEKTDEIKYTSACSLPASSPGILADLASTLSSLSNEEDLTGTSGSQELAETMAPSLSCAFLLPAPGMEKKQRVDKKGHGRKDLGGFSAAIREKAVWLDPTLGSNIGHSFCSAPGNGSQSSKCEDCHVKSPNSRICSKDPLKEFHYKYNTPGQNYLNHNENGAFVQPCPLRESKTSSLRKSHSKSQRTNSKSEGEHEPTPGKKHLQPSATHNPDSATPATRFLSCRISGSKSSCDFDSIEETKSQGLHSALDHALKTAAILKETTDQMIKTIAEDLAKAQRWKNRVKY